ncbi:MAG: MBL fold metallo-hydrolase [Deltaproteobacteria bacterium]|jgi:glyoxylase-like metal-dependent hydrolase (beta-lactamase superfamily II)|nr:MBL fold metallo-hydrolase [Deltaproteobacteria bacterium]
MKVYAYPLGPLETNCYLVVNGSEALAVDPGGDPSELVEFLKQKGLKLVCILNTHLHFDHILGNAALAKATGAPIRLHQDDLFLLDGASARRRGVPEAEKFEYQTLDPGEITLAGLRIAVIHSPGHSPGSLSFYFPDQGVLFSGDVLFYRDTGRSDLPGGSRPVLENETIRGKLYQLPDQTLVYPGHGPSTNIGEEKRENHWVTMT